MRIRSLQNKQPEKLIQNVSGQLTRSTISGLGYGAGASVSSVVIQHLISPAINGSIENSTVFHEGTESIASALSLDDILGILL